MKKLKEKYNSLLEKLDEIVLEAHKEGSVSVAMGRYDRPFYQVLEDIGVLKHTELDAGMDRYVLNKEIAEELEI